MPTIEFHENHTHHNNDSIKTLLSISIHRIHQHRMHLIQSINIKQIISYCLLSHYKFHPFHVQCSFYLLLLLYSVGDFFCVCMCRCCSATTGQFFKLQRIFAIQSIFRMFFFLSHKNIANLVIVVEFKKCNFVVKIGCHSQLFQISIFAFHPVSALIKHEQIILFKLMLRSVVGIYLLLSQFGNFCSPIHLLYEIVAMMQYTVHCTGQFVDSVNDVHYTPHKFQINLNGFVYITIPIEFRHTIFAR